MRSVASVRARVFLFFERVYSCLAIVTNGAGGGGWGRMGSRSCVSSFLSYTNISLFDVFCENVSIMSEKTKAQVWRLLLLFACCVPGTALSQNQAGSVFGNVADQNGAAVSAANVLLMNKMTGYRSAIAAGTDGSFAFHNVPFANYELSVSSNGFAVNSRMVTISSNVPVRFDVRLAVSGTSSEVTVSDLAVQNATQTQTQISAERLRDMPLASRTRGLPSAIASTPGITTENNGLLHVRGVEDGILYVIDGVPLTDRVDLASASGPDIGDVRSIQVITGNFPAEFGGRSGAVAVVQARSGLDEKVSGEITAGVGNFATNDVAGQVAAGWRQKLGIFASVAAARSNRYLDSVDLGNFNNHGFRRNLALRADWQLGEKDAMFFDFGSNGAKIDVPNDSIQQIAGQRQRQRFGDDNEAFSWQHIFSSSVVTNLVLFRRQAETRLFPSEFDTPITATADRRQTRSGVLASISFTGGGHAFKSGFEATHIRLREYFSFAITDEDLAEERGVSEEALEFTPADPFVFANGRSGRYLAAYIQDQFMPFKNLTVNAGIRFDHSELPATDNQLSPRIGVAYHIPRTGTTLRASFNRLFQPPQVENLLLSDSDEARELSPFADDGPGGTRVRAERVSAYEVGATQNIGKVARLDVAYWHRDFRNFGDPNTFFNTTIVFPNSVSKGFSRGTDVRLDILERRGVSAYASWTNSRILQTGPINGGLFLTDEFAEIGPGTKFIPDQDVRNVASFAVTYNSVDRRWFAAFGGRHESGVPLEVDEDRLAQLMNTPGSDLFNFDRSRVRPWTIFNLQAGLSLVRREKYAMRLEANIENIFNHRFAYNFGSPFEGTHFGHPRLFGARMTVSFR